jgi:hypothetical protein
VAGREGTYVAVEPRAGRSDCSGELLPIDEGTNRILGNPVLLAGRPNSLALGGGSIWVASTTCPRTGGYGGVLERIPPGATAASAEIEVGEHPFGVAFAHGSAWVARDRDGDSGEVIRVDLTSNRIVARIPVRGRLRDVVAGASGVWVLDTAEDNGGLIWIDPARNRPTRFAAGAYALAGSGGDVWAAGWSSSFEVTTGGEDSPSIGRVDGEETPGFGVDIEGARPVTADRIGVWLTGRDAARRTSALFHLSASTGRIDVMVPLGTTPIGASYDASRRAIWVANNEKSITRVALRSSPRGGGSG